MKASLFLACLLSAAAFPLDQRDNSGVKGVPYSDPQYLQPFEGYISWAYNYETQSGGLDSSFEYVPMIHDQDTDTSAISSGISQGTVQHVLGYNEPDVPQSAGGTGIAPDSAATSWQQQIPAAAGALVGSPAVSSSTVQGTGLDWLDQFVSALGGASNSKIDFVCIHWYGSNGASGSEQAQEFLNYVSNAIEEVDRFLPGKPIWVTEFAALPTGDQEVASDFLDSALPSLLSNSRVERIAPFGAYSGQLSDGNSLTQSGQVYATA